ncbi:MAG: hypothetical protein NWS74_12615 [Salibacteraceae bacterium]|jgi:hypothetical protein|nr:hypothetical protein [Salibacteraceae bacterium]MDP4843459.1 hypothetical protein [Salibacteraceae bacterium]
MTNPQLYKISLVVFVALISVATKAQNCALDKSGLSEKFSLYPSKSEKLAPAKLGVAYQQTISFKFPSTTSEISETGIINCPSYVPNGVTIRDVEISSIEGLPKGIEYECNSADCYWKEATYGAVCLKGIPVTSGKYDLTVTVEGVANMLFFPMAVSCTLKGYTILVE